MPSQPSHGRATSLAFAPAEWELLSRLPARVMLAATSVDPGDPHRTVASGIAGLDAIAAGRGSDSPLVRAVVGTIYTETAGADDPPDPASRVADVLADCRTAARLLRARADPADLMAYTGWLHTVADRVCGGSPAGERFTADLGRALG